LTTRLQSGLLARRSRLGDFAAVVAALPLAVSYEHAAIISVATVSKNEAVTDSDGAAAPALLTPAELAPQASGLRESLHPRKDVNPVPVGVPGVQPVGSGAFPAEPVAVQGFCRRRYVGDLESEGASRRGGVCHWP